MDESTAERTGLSHPSGRTFPSPTAGIDRLGLRQSELNALSAAGLQGATTITHPFHPRFSQQFVILKSRVVQGVECLILKGSPSGTFSVPRSWTSNSLEDHYNDAGVHPRLMRLEQLVELMRLVKRLADD